MKHITGDIQDINSNIQN